MQVKRIVTIWDIAFTLQQQKYLPVVKEQECKNNAYEHTDHIYALCFAIDCALATDRD